MQADRQEQGGTLLILPECVDALTVFLACQTQWRRDGMGAPMGLDYTAVRSVMLMLRTRQQARVFEQLLLVESAALNEFGRQRKQNKNRNS